MSCFEEKKSYSNAFNAERIVKIFRLGAELQLCVHNNGITFRITLIVGPIKRFVLDRKVTLQTLCTYEHCLWNGALISDGTDHTKTMIPG